MWDGVDVRKVFQTGLDDEYINIGFPSLKKDIRNKILKEMETLSKKLEQENMWRNNEG